MASKKQKSMQNGKSNVTKMILEYISEHPGVHFNDLNRVLGVAPGTLQYHLNRMEREKEIVVVRDKYLTHYFPSTMRDPGDQKIMELLRQNIPRRLLMILIEEPGKTGSELAKYLSITKSTLSYYAKRLEKNNLLETQIEGREKHYSVKNPDRIVNLLKKHKKSFGDKLVDRFVEIWVRI